MRWGYKIILRMIRIRRWWGRMAWILSLLGKEGLLLSLWKWMEVYIEIGSRSLKSWLWKARTMCSNSWRWGTGL